MSTSQLVDPEDTALLYVQQYLYEHGHVEALSALEASCGMLYDGDKLKEGSQLMKLIWNDLERQLAENDADSRHQQDDEQLLRGGCNDFPRTLLHTIDGLHSSSITCITWIPHTDTLITGSGNGMLHCFDSSGSQLWCTPVGSGGVLSVAVHPHAEGDNHPYIAVGSMGGLISVMDIRTGDLLASVQPHSKYVVRVMWAPDGKQLMSASWDQTVTIWSVQAAVGYDDPDDDAEVQMELITKVPFSAAVQDIAALPNSSTIIIALRDTNYLRPYDTHTLKELPPVNMNAAGDDHISFYARHLALSPCSKYLLVSTDSTRMLVLRTCDWSQCRVLHGLPVEQFHQPVAGWHRDSQYVFAAGAAGQLLVFHVGSAKVVATLRVHGKALRGLAYDGGRNVLATCSFDRTVRVLGWEGQQ